MSTHAADISTANMPNVSAVPVAAAANADADGSDICYGPVPPRRLIRVSVRYRVNGRGKPLPYELDEEEGGE